MFLFCAFPYTVINCYGILVVFFYTVTNVRTIRAVPYPKWYRDNRECTVHAQRIGSNTWFCCESFVLPSQDYIDRTKGISMWTWIMIIEVQWVQAIVKYSTSTSLCPGKFYNFWPGNRAANHAPYSCVRLYPSDWCSDHTK